MELLIPTMMVFVIDNGIAEGNTGYIIRMMIIMAVIAILGLCSALICQYSASIASQGFGTRLRDAMFEHITSMPDSQINKFGTPSLVNRITNDVNVLQQSVAMLIRLVIRAPFITIGSVVWPCCSISGVARHRCQHSAPRCGHLFYNVDHPDTIQRRRKSSTAYRSPPRRASPEYASSGRLTEPKGRLNALSRQLRVSDALKACLKDLITHESCHQPYHERRRNRRALVRRPARGVGRHDSGRDNSVYKLYNIHSQRPCGCRKPCGPLYQGESQLRQSQPRCSPATHP